jgi:protein-S-isoprenylcysteine O-methyltransferase Ste14
VDKAIATSAPTGWARIARRIRVPLGFLFAIFYFWMARPTWASLAVGVLIALPGTLVRALASGHVKKNEELTTTGPYAYSRNPLYLGSFILALGFAIAARSWSVGAAMLIFVAAIYVPVILSEEAYLRANFADFDEYTRRVPRLVPRWMVGAAPVAGGFSRDLYLKHREYNAALGTLAMFVALVAKLWFTTR